MKKVGSCANVSQNLLIHHTSHQHEALLNFNSIYQFIMLLSCSASLQKTGKSYFLNLWSYDSLVCMRLHVAGVMKRHTRNLKWIRVRPSSGIVNLCRDDYTFNML